MTSSRFEHVLAATRVLALERGSDASDSAEGAARVFEKMRKRLAPLIGEMGVAALFARSVRLTTTEYPCLGDLAVPAGASDNPSFSSDRLSMCLRKVDAVEASDAAIALLSTVLQLLTSFIGDALVWRVLRGAFPTIHNGTTKETES